MRRNESGFLLVYLSCSFALMLFAMSLIFHVLGYWINGGENLIELIKSNLYYYVKMIGVGFIAGFMIFFI